MNAERAWNALCRLVQAPSRPGVAGRVVKEASAGLAASEVSLWIRSRGIWHCRARSGSANSTRPVLPVSVPSCVLHGSPDRIRLPAGPSRYEPLAGRGPGWLLLAPVPGCRGFLAARLSGRRVPEGAQQMLRAFAVHAGSSLRERERVRRLRRLAETDDLTGAINYRALCAALRAHVRRASRRRSPFSILMLDLDHLKEYNERHGHLGGSELLRQVGALLMNAVRSGDIVAKYGGDEFVLILPDTGPGTAASIGERVRRAVSSRSFRGAKRGSITLSVGLAHFPADGATPSALLRSADRALFAAKRLGRNRVLAASRAA